MTRTRSQAGAKSAAELSPGGAGRRISRKVGVLAGLAAVVLGAGLVLVQKKRTTMEAASAAPKPAPIDGERAYGYLKEICALGPRKAGSPANTKQRLMVAKHFKEHGGEVREQPFAGRDPLSQERVAMVNLIGSWFPDRHDRVLISAHYDTRPFPDQDQEVENRKKPFLGANDCASGVALLMEIAHHLEKSPTPWGVDLVLFDGEELVYEGANDIGFYFLGSKAFARAYTAGTKSGKIKYVYRAGILLDMVGDKELAIDREVNSDRFARPLMNAIWGAARQIGEDAVFRDRVGQEVRDDHLPLLGAGIKTVDLIDFDYPFWHTAKDVPENCSAESLTSVGRVVTAWLSLPKRKY